MTGKGSPYVYLDDTKDISGKKPNFFSCYLGTQITFLSADSYKMPLNKKYSSIFLLLHYQKNYQDIQIMPLLTFFIVGFQNVYLKCMQSNFWPISVVQLIKVNRKANSSNWIFLMYCKTIIIKSKWQDPDDWLPLFQREKRAWKCSICDLCYRQIKERVDNNLSYYSQTQDSLCLAPCCYYCFSPGYCLFSRHLWKKENKFQTYDFWLILQDKSTIISLLNGSQDYKSFHWVAIIKVNKYVLNGTYT